MGYVVTAPLVIAKDEAGHDLYLYEGQEVPQAVKGDQIDRFKADGMIGEGEASGDAGSSDAPAKSASKADWVDYAVSQGAERQQAEDSTKDDLIERYGD